MLQKLFHPGAILVAGIILGLSSSEVRGQTSATQKLPSLMDERHEIALALSAAPAHISEYADLYVLRRGGYEKVREGTNGFACLVDRQYVDAIEPICHNPLASRTMLPIFLRRAELREAGLTKEAIERQIGVELESGALTLPTGLALSYMFSSGQDIYTDAGDHLGQYRPHVMIWIPFLERPDVVGTLPRPVERKRRLDPYVFRSGKLDAALNVIVPQSIEPHVVPTDP